MAFVEKIRGENCMKIDFKDLGERVLSTFVQAVAGFLATDQVIDMGVAEWKLVLGAGFAAVLSMLKGYFAARFTGDGSASLVTTAAPRSARPRKQTVTVNNGNVNVIQSSDQDDAKGSNE
jgi:hypothetical protein